MFGQRMRIKWGDLGVTLRPFRREDMAIVAEGMSSRKVNEFTLQRFGFTQGMEEDWLVKSQVDPSSVLWVVAIGTEDTPIGTTGLRNLDLFQSCTSGIIIFDPTYWGRGVASRAHIGRTWYAANVLDRATIQAAVLRPNLGSLAALRRVGYNVTGCFPKTVRHEHEFVDKILLTWFNPYWIPRLFPSGVPEEYAEGIRRAEETLTKAKEVVTFE